MPVVSRSTSAPAKESAIVSRATLRRQRGAVERATAWMVLVVSFLGSIAALSGGWKHLIEVARDEGGALPWGAIAAGIVAQLVLTWLQWSYYDRVAIAWPSRIVDATLTALGYGPLILDFLAAYFLSRGASESGAMYAAWGSIAVLSLFLAWYPESRLVD